MASDKARLDAIDDVVIDSNGRFKYILIQLYSGSAEKFIVRGTASAGFHGDIYDEWQPRISGLGVETECVGGGRILHDAEKKTIKVFGYSQGFGRADHSIATGLLKEKYPDYADISWSNDGY